MCVQSVSAGSAEFGGEAEAESSGLVSERSDQPGVSSM